MAATLFPVGYFAIAVAVCIDSDRDLPVRSLDQRTECEIASPGWCPVGSDDNCFRIHLWPLHLQSVMGGSGVRLRSRSRRIPSNWNAGRNVLASDCSQITDSESSHQRLTASKVCGPLAGLASPSDGHYRIASCWNGLKPWRSMGTGRGLPLASQRGASLLGLGRHESICVIQQGVSAFDLCVTGVRQRASQRVHLNGSLAISSAHAESP